MSQDFLERCNEKMQSLYDCCGKKVNELYAKLAEEVQSLYNHCKAQASELVANLLEEVQLLYNDCLEKIIAFIAQVKAVIAVAVAVALFGTTSPAALATTVGVLTAYAGNEHCKQGAG